MGWATAVFSALSCQALADSGPQLRCVYATAGGAGGVSSLEVTIGQRAPGDYFVAKVDWFSEGVTKQPMGTLGCERRSWVSAGPGNELLQVQCAGVMESARGLPAQNVSVFIGAGTRAYAAALDWEDMPGTDLSSGKQFPSIELYECDRPVASIVGNQRRVHP